MMRRITPGLLKETIAIAAALLFVIALAVADVDSSNEEEAVPPTLDNGLGSHIDWQSLDDGLARAKQEHKPLMLIIHKSWCGACRSLKPKFSSSQTISNLSKKFIMVNTMDDDEPPGDTYRPDGGYVPRLLFFGPDGELLDNIMNENGNPQYKYYYYDETSIAASMEKVSTMFSIPSDIDTNDNDDASIDRNQIKGEL